MNSTARLYSPEVLALATTLGDYPLTAGLPLTGRARSSSCGSVVELALATNAAGAIDRIGIKAQACAIGQASAALFARGAAGQDRAAIAAALTALQAWLAQAGPMPDWPGLATLAPAIAFPGRHGVILLAWQAASGALAPHALPTASQPG